MFVIEKLRHRQGEFILKADHIEFPSSGITAIRGPSGSGKTTLFRILSGEIVPQSWKWTLDGVDLSNLEIGERRLGIVFQSYDLFPNLTAEENVQIVMRARKNLSAQSLERLNAALDKLNLQSCWKTVASQLSGGEKQRVALLRALMSNPRYLLLDEPFSALNPELRDESRRLVKSLIHEFNIGALLITHDQKDVEVLADRLIEISNGQFSSAIVTEK